MKNQAPKTVYELLSAAADESPKKKAITFIEDLDALELSTSLSYEQLISRLHKTVHMMRGLTEKSHPVVSILLPNIPQAQIILWAAEAAGIGNPLNPLLNEESLFQLMLKAKTDIIFALGPMPGSALWEKAVSVANRLPNKPTCVSVYRPAGKLYYDSDVSTYEDIPLFGESAPAPSDIAAYYHTGGTTGTPKLACHTHENQVAAALAVIRSLQLTGVDIAINGLPIFHVAGAIVNSLAVLSAGGELVIPTLSGFRNPNVIRQHWRLIQSLKVTISSGIPTSMASMLDAPLEGADIRSLRFLLTGGAPVPLKLHGLSIEKLGKQLYQAYGMTESSGVIALPDLSQPAVWGSVGRVGFPVEVRIDAGEICVRGPMVFPGYLGGGASSTSDGWLRTGDLGRLDEAGNLFITGRVKDLIIRSGHNIDPALIECCLEQHPAVSMAAAVGMPDEYAGELPVVFIQLRDGMGVTSGDLHNYALENIAERPACPKKVIILDTLPITTVGKVFKPKLREIAIDMLLEELLFLYMGPVGIKSSHSESGQLSVDLWDIPQSEARWYLDQLKKLNLQLGSLSFR